MMTSGGDSTIEHLERVEIQRLKDKIKRTDALVGEQPDGHEFLHDEKNEEYLRRHHVQTPSSTSPWPSQCPEDTPLQDLVSLAYEVEPTQKYKEPKFERQSILLDRGEVESLLETFFLNINAIFPLFDREVFMDVVEQHYLGHPHPGPGWWACLNIALALSYKLHIWSSPAPERASNAAWLYFNNAMQLWPELSNPVNDIRCIQALVAMLVFTRASAPFNDASPLLATAIHLSHQLFMPHPCLDASYVEERRRLLHILYILDQDVCIQSGLPPMMESDFVTAQSNTGDDLSNIFTPNQKSNILDLLCSLASLEDQVYRQLYSAQAQLKPAEQLLDDMEILDEKIQTWGDRFLPETRHGTSLALGDETAGPQVVFLHFKYYNCIMTIHRMPRVHCPYSGLLSRTEDTSIIHSRIVSSAQRKRIAAISCIDLLKHLRSGCPFPFWLLPYYTVSALFLLFQGILTDSDSSISQIQHSIAAMDSGVGFLQYVTGRTNGDFQEELGLSRGLTRISKAIANRTRDLNCSREVAEHALGNAVRELHRGSGKASKRGRRLISRPDDTHRDEDTVNHGTSVLGLLHYQSLAAGLGEGAQYAMSGIDQGVLNSLGSIEEQIQRESAELPLIQESTHTEWTESTNDLDWPLGDDMGLYNNDFDWESFVNDVREMD